MNGYFPRFKTVVGGEEGPQREYWDIEFGDKEGVSVHVLKLRLPRESGESTAFAVAHALAKARQDGAREKQCELAAVIGCKLS